MLHTNQPCRFLRRHLQYRQQTDRSAKHNQTTGTFQYHRLVMGFDQGSAMEMHTSIRRAFRGRTPEAQTLYGPLFTLRPQQGPTLYFCWLTRYTRKLAPRLHIEDGPLSKLDQLVKLFAADQNPTRCNHLFFLCPLDVMPDTTEQHKNLNECSTTHRLIGTIARR